MVAERLPLYRTSRLEKTLQLTGDLGYRRRMRRVCFSTSLAIAVALAGCGDDGDGKSAPPWAPAPYVQYVSPYIGTGGLGFGHGAAVVGALAPFGMVRLSPDSTMSAGAIAFHHFSGYHYDDSIIRGFSHLHFHGTGVQGYGNLLFMPVPGFTPDKITPRRYRSPFVKEEEVATPGYYSARLTNGDILAELTTTGRAGLHRYTFNQGSAGAAVVIDAGFTVHEVVAQNIEMTLDPEARMIVGRHRSVGGLSRDFDLFWAIAFDQPLKAYGIWRGTEVTAGATSLVSPSAGGGMYLEFDLPDGGMLNMRAGLSMVDIDGARNNLAVEAPDFAFDVLRAQTEARWESLLGRLKIAETDPSLLTTFYTAAYHTLVMPTVFSDADGRYLGFDGQIHQADDFEYYSDLSLWDTFRTLHPWLTLAYPEIQRDIIVSLLKMYEQDGFLPIWPISNADSGTLIGASAELVIADSYVKGLRDYDTALAYEAVTRSGREPSPAGSSSPGRRHVNEYLELGYVAHESSDKGASMTLEYAASDGAIAEFAKAFGNQADAVEFDGRAKSYRNHWDPQTRFFRAKRRDATFKMPFDPNEWGVDYVESTAWQYLWYVPHDPQGLIELFGGREPFVAAMEDFFARSKHEYENLTEITRLLFRIYYWAGNEPDIATPYLFVDAGRADLAGKWARWALDTSFGDGPDGLPGNDDCGTMSSWYLFTALGFFPVPGYDKYYVGAPRYAAAEIELPGGAFRITAPNAGAANYLPRSASLDGEPLPDFIFRHTDIAAGGELEVELSAE
jgi:predicted alpha-1,2-mannosidase